MLKNKRVLFLGLMVLAGSACVTPTHASSASPVIITQVQAGGVGNAKEESIVIYNNSSQVADITNWCFTNKYAVRFACFKHTVTDENGTTALSYYIPPHSYATVVSEEYAAKYPPAHTASSLVFAVTSTSSGSIVGGADTISLINSEGVAEDAVMWASSLAAGKVYARIQLIATTPVVYAMSGNPSDWEVVAASDPPTSNLEIQETYTPHPEPSEDTGEQPNPLALPVIITEILPNPAGSDTGAEFIELYNTSATESVVLTEYRLRIGVDSYKWFSLPVGEIIQPLSYRAFYNSELGYTLVNTAGQVQLFKEDTPVQPAVSYASPKDDESWALIEQEWMYVKPPTPGAANIKNTAQYNVEKKTAEVASQKPCADNQFRNPETGRCKRIDTATTTQTPCKVGQERNPETNRCRSIASLTKEPAPCKEGQERNPETNRCRNIVKMSNANYGIKGVQIDDGAQPQWYYWGAIALIALLVLGYAVWEWRQEIATAKDAVIRRARSFISR